MNYKVTFLEDRFPVYSDRIKNAVSRWRSVFYSSVVYADAGIKELLGNKYLRYKSHTDSVAKATAVKEVSLVNFENIESIVTELENRHLGEMASPWMEYYLKYNPKYIVNPQLEYADGFKQTFETNGDGKSKGLKIMFHVPKSWKRFEGKLRNEVIKYSSDTDNGLVEYIFLLQDATTVPDIIPLLVSDTTAEEAAQKILTQDFANSFAQKIPGGKATNIKLATVDSHPAMLFDVSAESNSGGSTMKSNGPTCILLYENFVIQFYLPLSNTNKSGDQQEALLSSYRNLFTSVLDGVVILSQYRIDETEYRIKLADLSNTYRTSILIAGKTFTYVVDTEAPFFTITPEMEKDLLNRGIIDKDSYLDDTSIQGSDGQLVEVRQLILNSVWITDVNGQLIEAKNVQTVVTPAGSPALFGLSFLKRFKTWSIDKTNSILKVRK